MTISTERLCDLKQMWQLEEDLIALKYLTALFKDRAQEIIEADRNVHHEVFRDAKGRVRVSLTSDQFQFVHFMHKHVSDLAERALERLENLQKAASEYVREGEQ